MTALNAFLKEQHTDQSLIEVFDAICRGALIVQSEVSRAGLGADIYGAKGSENVQGEEQQKLDVFADECFIKEIRGCGHVVGLASEEQDNALQFDESINGEYIFMIDPLDGSSNIDVNVAIGTIFAVYRRISKQGESLVDGDFLQPGKNLVAAGYVNYSVSTQLVFSIGNGTHVFTLDPKDGKFKLIKESVMFPSDGKVYSINEVNLDDFDDNLKRYAQHCKDKRKSDGKRMYTGRYIGSLVADFHRNLLKGGIYVYPATNDSPKGKLRLLYECNPMTFLAVNAGGKGSDGKQNILDIVPTELHQRTPFYVGSPVMMDEAIK
ncbi:MAG: class 1 fructose-bisphosphatase [Flavobacteriales bacterium]